MLSVLIRADGNAALGIGHLSRCAVLAKELIANGCAVTCIRRTNTDGEFTDLNAQFATRWIGGQPANDDADCELRDAHQTLSHTSGCADGLPWVVVDHYDLGETWEKTVREAGCRVLAIDDFRDRRHCADVLVSDYPEPFRAEMNDCADTALQLTGFEYALVDRAFTVADFSTAPAVGPPRILVTFGGSDPTGETSKVCEALAAVSARVSEPGLGKIDVVIGPANRSRFEVEQSVARLRDVKVHVGPKSLAPLMREADLVLTAGGNSLVEALTLAKPCWVIVTTANQTRMVEQLNRRQLVRVLGRDGGVGVAEMATSIETVLSELPLFREHVRRNTCFDHLGASRIVAAMANVEARA